MEDFDKKYSRANASVASAFAYGVDVLHDISVDIATTYSDEILENEEARICRVIMTAASAFEVSFNPFETITAKLNDAGAYEVDYEGDLEYIVFGGSEEVTLTYFGVGWVRSDTKHYEVTVTSAAQGVTPKVYGIGNHEVPADENGKYHLLNGGYVAKASGHADFRFIVNGDGAIVMPA